MIRETVRDTTVVFKADSSLITALLECDSLGQVRLKQIMNYKAGQRLPPPQLIIKDNMLTAKATIDSSLIHIAWLEKQLEYYKTQDKQDFQLIEVNRLTWWQNLWCALGQILSAVVIVFIAYKLTKLIKFK